MTFALASKSKQATSGKRAAKRKPAATRRTVDLQSGLGVHPPIVAPTIQTKLKIGEPNDKYEQEADKVADEVMRMPKPAQEEFKIQRKVATQTLQRMCRDCEEQLQQLQRSPVESRSASIQFKDNLTDTLVPQLPDITTSQLQPLNCSGQPLSAALRSFFEPRFGQDLSHVRVHTDKVAADSAQSVDALAYTHKHQIVFNQNAFQPNTSRGKHLLAHEITHVLQQGDGRELRRQPRRGRRGRRTQSVRHPKLSLYQIDDLARNHFHGEAHRKAQAIGAIQLDSTNQCPPFVRRGATPFRSGAEIIELIAKAYWCTGQQLQELHVFSHGFTGGGGIVASEADRRGLVTDSIYLSEGHRERGARRVEDIQSEPFANNAVVVLHGCQIGAGDNSFAEQMLRHLVGDRPQIRIFAHLESGVCGRFTDWREFNQRFPEGRTRRINPYHRPDVIQRTPLEEERRLQNPIATQFVQNSTLSLNIDQLVQALSRVSSVASAQAVVNWWGYKLWEDARSVAQQQGNTDDRTLYWVRLRMRQIIRNFNPGSRFTLSPREREQLISGFESSSRGMPTGGGTLAWIPTAKKILISGFDPFQLDRNPSQGNPSGAAVLALDGKVVRHTSQPNLTGQIQGVILPVSFSYFDAGNVEQFFRPYIQSENPVDMVITISQGIQHFELEEYASRFRDPSLFDNEDEPGRRAMLPPGDEFTRSTLPRERMRREILNRSLIPEETEFRGVYQGREITGPSDAHPDPSRLTTASGGSGGVYLSNEVFYRTTLLRDTNPNTSRQQLPVGHLHLPIVEDYARQSGISNIQTRNQIVNVVERLIVAALPDL